MMSWKCPCGRRVPFTCQCDSCGRMKPLKKKAGVELSQRVLALGKELDKTRREREELRAGVEFAEKRISRQKEQLDTAWAKVRFTCGTQVTALKTELLCMGRELASTRNELKESEEVRRAIHLDLLRKEAVWNSKPYHNDTQKLVHTLENAGGRLLREALDCLPTSKLADMARAVHGRIYKRLER